MRNKRIVVSLDDAAAEGLASLSEWLGLGEDALARRLLNATLNVIAGAMEAEAPKAEPEAPESPLEKAGGWEGLRRDIAKSKGEVGWYERVYDITGEIKSIIEMPEGRTLPPEEWPEKWQEE